MKKTLSILLLYILFHASVYGQVTGKAYLSDATDHSGIKVKFLADSPTAKTDSTLTNLTGAYSLVLSGGVYKVSFSKEGYKSNFYNGNAPVAIASSSSLQDVTLLGNNYVSVMGKVSGTWEKEYIYVVESNLIVDTNATLTIEPGTQIYFNNLYHIDVIGTLIADGTANDSIHFSGAQTPNPILWEGIVFHPVSKSTSLFDYCKMSYCENCITISNNGISVTHSNFSHIINGISAGSNSIAIIENNEISNFNSSDSVRSMAKAIAVRNKSKISCNYIYTGNGIGIEAGDSAQVSGNTINNIQPGFSANYGAILVVDGSPLLKNNITTHSQIGIQVLYQTSGIKTEPRIFNNTVAQNSIGISYFDNIGLIQNNIIAHNNSYGIVGNDYDPNKISYNLLFNHNNFPQNNTTFLGTVVSTNENGGLIDSYFNVYSDPLFTELPYIGASSPARSSGSDKKDIGTDQSLNCIKTITSVAEEKVKDMTVNIYPNPVNDLLNVFSGKDGILEVNIYSTLGVLLITEKVKGSEETISTSTLPKGVYFVTVTQADGHRYTTSLVKE